MRRAEPLAGLGGIALLVGVLAGDGVGVSGAILLALAGLALAVPVVSVATRGPAPAVRSAVLVAGFGWVAVLIGALRLLDGASTADWLVFGSAVLAWVGGWLSLRDESTPGAVAPTVPRRPAP